MAKVHNPMATYVAHKQAKAKFAREAITFKTRRGILGAIIHWLMQPV